MEAFTKQAIRKQLRFSSDANQALTFCVISPVRRGFIDRDVGSGTDDTLTLVS